MHSSWIHNDEGSTERRDTVTQQKNGFKKFKKKKVENDETLNLSVSARSIGMSAFVVVKII